MFAEVYGIWGAGLVHRDTNYRGVDASTDPAPIIMGGIGNLSIEANRAAYTLYRDGTWFGSAVGLYRSNQSLDKDDARALGIGERKPALEAGAQIGRRLPFGWAGRLAATRDISGAHASAEYDLQFYRHDDFGPVRLLSSIGGQYLSSGLTDYYYGTDSHKPDAALALEVEFIASMQIEHLGVFVGTRNFFYDHAVSNSPLVERSAIIQVFLGAGYYF